MQNQFQIGDSIWIETTNNNQITYYKSKIISLDFPNKLL